MCGVPPYAVTAIHTHAEDTPHCTSPRLLRVWGHSTGRLPCCVSYQNTREGSIQASPVNRRKYRTGAIFSPILSESLLAHAERQRAAVSAAEHPWCPIGWPAGTATARHAYASCICARTARPRTP